MNYRDPIYNKHGTIDCEVEHPVYGWVPITLQPNDEPTAELYGIVLDAGSIAPYVAPSIEQVRIDMAPLTRRQFRLGMRGLGITTTMIDTAIGSITEVNERELALIEWEEAQSFDRMHPLVVSMTSAFGVSPDAVDAMWNEVSTA